MPLEVLDSRHLEVHVHVHRHGLGGPGPRRGVLLLLNGQDSVAVFIEKDQPVSFIRAAVGRRLVSVPIPQPEELSIELARASAVARIDIRVKQTRIAGHARLSYGLESSSYRQKSNRSSADPDHIRAQIDVIGGLTDERRGTVSRTERRLSAQPRHYLRGKFVNQPSRPPPSRASPPRAPPTSP